MEKDPRTWRRGYFISASSKLKKRLQNLKNSKETGKLNLIQNKLMDNKFKIIEQI
jgi:hypothetical protein